MTQALMPAKLDAELQILIEDGTYADVKAILEQVEEKRKRVGEIRGMYPLYVH